jgi:hypothetical protein
MSGAEAASTQVLGLEDHIRSRFGARQTCRGRGCRGNLQRQGATVIEVVAICMTIDGIMPRSVKTADRGAVGLMLM